MWARRSATSAGTIDVTSPPNRAISRIHFEATNECSVAEGMNNLQKVVFSRTLDKASWKNTKLVRGDLVEEVRKMKKESGPDMVILGSGSIVSQLAQAGLIDEYQVALSPILLGKGRTMFEGVKQNVNLKKTRVFDNGKVMLWYEPAA